MCENVLMLHINFFNSKLHWNWKGRTNDMYFLLFIAVWFSQMKLLTFCLIVQCPVREMRRKNCCDSVHTNRSRRSTNSYIPICCSPWIINTHSHQAVSTFYFNFSLQPKFYFSVVGFALLSFDFSSIEWRTLIEAKHVHAARQDRRWRRKRRQEKIVRDCAKCCKAYELNKFPKKTSERNLRQKYKKTKSKSATVSMVSNALAA